MAQGGGQYVVLPSVVGLLLCSLFLHSLPTTCSITSKRGGFDFLSIRPASEEGNGSTKSCSCLPSLWNSNPLYRMSLPTFYRNLHSLQPLHVIFCTPFFLCDFILRRYVFLLLSTWPFFHSASPPLVFVEFFHGVMEFCFAAHHIPLVCEFLYHHVCFSLLHLLLPTLLHFASICFKAPWLASYF